MMPAKAFPLAVCRHCQRPHDQRLDCSVALDLRQQLSIKMAKAETIELQAEAWHWYDQVHASYGIKTNFLERFPALLEAMKRKPAKDPQEALAGHSDGQKVSTSAGKVPKVSKKVDTSAKSVQKVSTESVQLEKSVQQSVHSCVQCGYQWPQRKKPPLRCPNKKCRRRRWQG